MNRSKIKSYLKRQIDDNNLVVGVAVGNGRSAKQAYEGGADIILALNAGRYRMSGLPSIASFLPSSNSNELVFDFGSHEITPQIKDIPIVFGACAQDYNYTHETLIDLAIKKGFTGINNFPTVSLIDGHYREYLEENSEGFIEEVKLMEKAVQKGLFTIAFAVTLEEAIQMAKINVDVLCLHFGWTYSSKSKDSHDVEVLVQKTKFIFDEVLKINKNIIPMIYGGTLISDYTTMTKFFEETKVKGYIGGSVFEIFPVENSIKEATQQFKGISHIMKLEEENRSLKKKLLMRDSVKDILGESEEIKNLITTINKTAEYDSNVLVYGESGSGKDLVVKAIHYNSARAAQPFIKLNLSSMPAENVVKELFGYEKDGQIYQGKFELVNGGTLFLDNIHEMDLDIQRKITSIIQDAKFNRVNGNEEIPIDVRIIGTTTENINDLVEKGLFRKDLYYLLNILTIKVPSLRSHKEDIPLYVETFLNRLNEKNKRHVTVSDDVMYAFMQYDWPGNKRELKNVLERGFVLCENEVIELSCLPYGFGEYVPPNVTSNYIKKSVDIIEKEMILTELKKYNWNRTRVAEKLKLSRRTLYNKIKKYNLFKENEKK